MAEKDKQRLALVTAEAADLEARFKELFERANKTKATPADAAALREFLRDNEGERLWNRVGGCLQLAESHALENLPVSAGIAEVWRFRLADLKDKMAGEDAPTLERMLAQQAALCWLRLAVIELRYTQANNTGNLSLAAGLYWEKRLTAAQRRFAKACEALARVRALLARAETARAQASKARIGSSLAVLKQMTG